MYFILKIRKGAQIFLYESIFFISINLFLKILLVEKKTYIYQIF